MANRSIEPHVYENDFDRLALLDQRLELLAQTASEVREDLSWLHTRFGYARAQAFTGLPPGTIRNWSNFLPITPVLARVKEHRTWMLDPERGSVQTEPAAAVPQQPSTVERSVQTEPAAAVPQQPSTVERSVQTEPAAAVPQQPSTVERSVQTEPAAAVPQQPSTVERSVQTEPAAAVPQQPSTVERSVQTEPAAAVPQQPSTVERSVQTEPAAAVPQQPSTVERSERSAEALAERDRVKLFEERGRETFRHLVHGDWDKAVAAVIDDEGRVDEDMLWRELAQRNVSRAAEYSRDSRGP